MGRIAFVRLGEANSAGRGRRRKQKAANADEVVSPFNRKNATTKVGDQKENPSRSSSRRKKGGSTGNSQGGTVLSSGSA